MQPTPLYNAETLRAAYQLRYSWTGWLKSLWPEMPGPDILKRLDEPWGFDGFRHLEHAWHDDHLQITFSVKPTVSPVLLATRVKGRLQHLFRTSARGFPGFTRKVSVRSIGDNATHDVESYIASQIETAAFVDARYADKLRPLTRVCLETELAIPTESARGQYWYNLHLVLVAAGRGRVHDLAMLQCIFDHCFKVAAKKGHRIAAISVMPDHLHMALRGDIERSPQEIAMDFLNNLAYRLGQVKVWQDGYYAGTFSEYDMYAIRRCAEEAGRS